MSIASTSSPAKPLAAPQIEQRVERRVRAGARRIQLHGDPGVEDLPARAEIGERRRRARAARCPSPRRNPCGPSIAAALAVIPACASSAASTPLRAASPACSGFTIVPKFSFRPDASDAAIASACPAAAASSPSSRRRRGRGADRPERRRAVPAALIVARVHRAAEPPFDLEADDVGVEQRARPTRRRLRPPPAPPAPAARSDARARRSTCRRSRARARRCRWPAPRRRRWRASAVPRTRARRRCPRPSIDALDDARGRLGRAGQRDADRVEHARVRRAARASAGGVARRRRSRAERSSARLTARLPCVAASGLPIAAMKRCLMNTQSSGGFAVGADSATLATITHGPRLGARRAMRRVELRLRSAPSRSRVTPIARAAASRSAPCAVAVSWPPVVAYSSLSNTTSTRFAGRSQSDGRQRSEIHQQRAVAVEDEDAEVGPRQRQAEADRRGEPHAAPGVEIRAADRRRRRDRTPGWPRLATIGASPRADRR